MPRWIATPQAASDDEAATVSEIRYNLALDSVALEVPVLFMQQPARPQTYRDLLDAMMESAMVVLRRIGAEVKSTDGVTPELSIDQVARHYAVLSMIVRRAIVVSHHLDGLPAPVEQRQGRIPEALERVFGIFAANKMEADAYHAALDAEIDGPTDDDDELEDDEFASEPVENADVPGRPAAALVAELCRDVGMALHAVPAHWLDPIPQDFRLLCARAAAAAIKPSPAPQHAGPIPSHPG